jgi:two-component system, LytTR family, sensor kinase
MVRAVIAAAIIFIPYAFFVYYFSYYAFNKLTSGKGLLVWHIFEILIVLTICIFIVRFCAYHILAKHVYKVPNPSKPYSVPRILSTIIYMGFSTGIMMMIKSVRNQLLAKERENKLIKEKMTSELKFLRNQLNPHFLFNTLNNIYALTRRKSDKAPEAVMKLSELLSFMLYETGKEMVPISRELDLLDDFIELEKMRYNDSVIITFEKDIDDMQQPVSPLIFLPFVENAFKHGLSEKPENPYIAIEIKLKQQQILFSVENSFYSKHQSTKKNGNLGLINSRRLIELTYSKQELTITSKDNIYNVQLKIDLNSYGKI